MAQARRRAPKGSKQRKLILVLTEGEVTEREYLKTMQKMMPGNRAADVKLGPAIPDPLQLVQRAITLQSTTPKRRDERTHDEIWCVFDVDARSSIQQPIDLATQNGINVAVSNPCFELWLVLHRVQHANARNSHQMQKKADRLKLISKKHIRPQVHPELMDKYSDAKQRAQALDLQHSRNMSPPRSNPSTEVWKLVEEIIP